MSLTEALGGFGKFLGGFGKLWSFGRLWEALEGFGMLQKALEGFGSRVRAFMSHKSEPLEGLEEGIVC